MPTPPLRRPLVAAAAAQATPARRAVLLGLLSAGALAGCAGGGTSAGSATSAASAASPAASSAASAPSASSAGFPATVTTAFGDVTVPSAPQRVVALGWGDAETALALGVQPVGASDWLAFGGEGVGPWAAGLYTTAPATIGTLEPSYEQIAALRPDLILDVKGSGDADRHARLSSIATTVGVPAGAQSYLTTLEQQVTMISTALGDPAKGAALLADAEAAVATARAAHPQWAGRTATAATRTSEGWGAYIDGSERVALLQGLGFVQNPQVAALPTSSTGFSVDVSSEQLDLLDADVIVAFPIYVPTATITDDPLWKALPAVAAGRAVVIDGDLAAAYSLDSVLSRRYAVDGLVPLLTTASA